MQHTMHRHAIEIEQPVPCSETGSPWGTNVQGVSELVYFHSPEGTTYCTLHHVLTQLLTPPSEQMFGEDNFTNSQ